MLGTYGALRVMLTVIAVSLPIVVTLSGWLHKGEPWLASSISKYYWAPTRFAFLTPRDFFVSGLRAAAVCLYAYKGFSTRENVALRRVRLLRRDSADQSRRAAEEPQDISARDGGGALALYWWFKTLEMRETKAENRGLDGELERRSVAPILPGAPDHSPLGPVDRAIRGAMVAGQPTERVVPATSPAPEMTGTAASTSSR